MTEEIATALGETNNKNSNLQNCLYPSLHPSYPPFTSQNSITSTTTTTTCSDSSSERSWTGHERPAKLLKASTCGSSSSSHLFSFSTSASMASNLQQQVYGNLQNPSATPKKESVSQEYNMTFGSLSSGGVHPNNQNSSPKAGLGIKRAYPVSRTPSSAQDHILAERKRREKLSQRFIALSAIVPGLKRY